ncbi:hypothetical protein GQ44DRAFT_766103 [Phaeosphaeriaceae sp. PMI808]|nr:hypothetical protein GQ44DRAFT_766103 [Phaeosphaeriaceae sp. PMI808]
MTLRDAYAAFLVNPSTGALADNASLHYITTLTSIHDATAIIKHLAVQEKRLKKKSQKVLSAVEGSHGLSLDVETTIEFQQGGGAYLPGLDDNFVADRLVTFPMIHMVHFDNARKITQIRLYWDQGALLKQIDVIGARSNAWPIRDSKEQVRLIASSSAVATQPDSVPSSRRSTASRGADEVSIASRSRGSTSATGDPHASLSLFQNRSIEEEEEEDNSHGSWPAAPRAQSAKPPPREYSELFVGQNSGSPSPSPQKIPVKAGGGRNYKANRLFEDAEDNSAEQAKPSSIKTNPKKFEHFAFGDGEDAPKVRDTARPETRGKSQASWDFESFTTPNKTKTKTQPQAVRHFGWSDDEVGLLYQPERLEDEVSPVRRPVVHKARPDADPHFEFVDDGTPDGQRQQPTKGRIANKGMGLYQDHVTGTKAHDEDDTPYDDDEHPLSQVTHNIKNENRKKDFASHWDMTDDSPAASKNGTAKKPVVDNHQATKSNWSLYQNSPDTRGGINIAGNGMGGRKGGEVFSLYEESPAHKENVNGNKGARERGIKTEGDGMGGKKGNGFSWDF